MPPGGTEREDGGGVTWSPGDRPAWVQHLMAGEGGPLYTEAAEPFDTDRLVAEAMALTGLHDVGGGTWRAPLEVLLRSADEEVDLNPAGRWRLREMCLRLLQNRLLIAEEVRRDPGILDEPIEAPIFVTGFPRAGTSVLHQLLALQPSARVPMAWELWAPAPAPRPESHAAGDPRIRMAERDVRFSAALAPGFDGIHEQGAQLPRECMSSMAHDFRSDVFGAWFGVPSYRHFLDRTDWVSAYRYHRLVLQLLQRHFAPRPWVLKAPGHVNHLDALLEVFPDARIVVCHRDPLAMLSSLSSLTATLRWGHAGDVDLHAVAVEQADTMAAQCERTARFRDDGVVPPVRVVDVRFDQFTADPAGTVRRVYEHFGMAVTEDMADRVRAHLGERPAGRHGGHEHSFADLGLDRDEQRRRFAAYQARFDIPSEDR
jgi:hypothetical protein